MRKGISMLLAVLFCLNLFAQTKPSKGDGSDADPYKISDAQELLWFAELVNGKLNDVDQNLSACAELTNDIDLSEVCGEGIGSWSPIGFTDNQYSGTFDGKGYGIKNLYINGTSAGLGFFGLTKYATISNLSILSGSVFSRGNTIGALAGNAYQSTITNCHNYISVSGGKFTGGIVGYTNGSTISKCHNEGDIKLNSDFGCGGICGATYGAKVSYCYNIGKITGSDRTGAIVGSHENGASLKNSFAYNSSVRLIGYNATSSSPKQCYLYDTKNDSSKDQFASGEICYLLNDNNKNIVFHQALGSNDYPIFDGINVVEKDENGYYNIPIDCEHAEKGTVAPTCTKEGYDYCKKCYKKFNIIPTIAHDTTISVTSTPTCITIGYSTASCGVCGLKHYYCDTVPTLDHDTVIKTVKASCSQIGYKYHTCNACKKTLGYFDTVPALGHDTLREMIGPYCSHIGYTRVLCKICWRVLYNCDTVPAIGHDTVTSIISPLCVSVGYTQDHCSRCDISFLCYDTVPALGHDSVVSTLHPTCNTKGCDTILCRRCKKLNKKEEIFATMKHVYVNDICSVCGSPRYVEPKLEDGYYLISNAREMQWLAEYVNAGHVYANAKLEKDIDLSEVCNETIGNWTPIYHFAGKFDGQHHKISGLYINKNGDLPDEWNVDMYSGLGLFSGNYGEITRVGIAKNCVIKSDNLCIGAVCAVNHGLVSYCYNEADVESKHGIAGGVVGFVERANVVSCYNVGQISGDKVAGIIGCNNCSAVSNCHNYGPIQRETSNYGDNDISHLLECDNLVDNYILSNTICDTVIDRYDKIMKMVYTSEIAFADGSVCYALNKNQDSTVWYQTLNVDPYPVLDPTHGKVLYDEEKGIYYNYPDIEYSEVHEIKDEKQTASLLTFVVNRQVIVIGVDSFRIINMFGHDVTALNGSLADGIYVVVADGNVAKVVVK